MSEVVSIKKSLLLIFIAEIIGCLSTIGSIGLYNNPNVRWLFLFAIFSIPAMILSLVGLFKIRFCNKDYHNAYACNILAVLLAIAITVMVIISIAVNSVEWGYVAFVGCEIAFTFVQAVATVLIIKGTQKQIGDNSKLQNLSSTALLANIIFPIVYIVIYTLYLCNVYNGDNIVLLIIALVTILLQLTGYILYLIYIARARKLVE